MTNNIVALFDDREEATRAKAELISRGFSESSIRIVVQQGGGSSAGSTTASATDASFWDDVKDFFGFGHEAEQLQYQEGIRRGGTLLIVSADERQTETATDVLMEFSPVDIEKRSADWQAGSQAQPRAVAQSATSKASTPSLNSTMAATAATARTATAGAGQAIPVTEEQLRVGKREVKRGIRIHQRVTERPVEEQVQLRDERVTVERRPVTGNTAVQPGAFQDRTFDVSETHEEAVVTKEARVVEEVVVNRDVKQRTETVRDTVRRTDVEVEQLGQAGQSGSTVDVDTFGSTLATDQKFRGRDWDSVETDARATYERGNPGSKWDQVRDAVHRAYDRARTKV